MRSGLDGKVVLVTGAARGIGEHTARLAAARGARLALVGLEAPLLAKLADDLPGRHYWAEADVTDQAALDAAVAGARAALGGIDAVVANAGLANIGTVAAGPVDALVRTIEVNLIGVVRTVAATLPAITERRGYFLLISSAAAFSALPGMAAYCASKAGVEQFGAALRLETRHLGVRVGTAHPSWIDTDLVRDIRADLPAFNRTLSRLPWPLGQTTSVQACAEALVDAVERRRRRVYVPRPVGLVQAMRTLVNGPLADRVIGRTARTTVPELEERARSLGRAFGAHSMGNR
ncbi:short-chain dehydrogenase/reductase [Rhizomonospora bruguierae]|uniref:short-chain dehydrogenase/reductase n=1 Tax=Rhizomonospora bruguierae TaxID=1581705 RepID=UPI001BCA7C10|nr:short-chain dehydrogenase/reductase [Micromonospora sp. NBRC 107566]